MVTRAERTLEIMHRWGYAPTIETLASELIHGSVDPAQLTAAIADSSRALVQGGFVCLLGHQDLLEKSRHRVATNRRLNGNARSIALEFATDLFRLCPVVDCIALSGSVASGGYVSSDDIDLDLFVREDSKYLTYAIALALGLRTSIRHRNGGQIRKIICINVIWTRGQTSPFSRTDEALAFELLHCRPIFGAEHFRQVLNANPWVNEYFPQLVTRVPEEGPGPVPHLPGKIVVWVAAHPRLLKLANRVGKTASFVVYSVAHWLKRRDAVAMARLDFLRRVKYPYEVFQD